MNASVKQTLLEASIGCGIIGFLMFLNCVTSSGEALEKFHLSVSMTTAGWIGLTIIAGALGIIAWCCMARNRSNNENHG